MLSSEVNRRLCKAPCKRDTVSTIKLSYTLSGPALAGQPATPPFGQRVGRKDEDYDP
jgi:hypothetical protein